MATPHACPVCKGHGTVSKPPHVPGDQSTWTASNTTAYPCHACSGRGIVWGADTPVNPIIAEGD